MEENILNGSQAVGRKMVTVWVSESLAIFIRTNGYY